MTGDDGDGGDFGENDVGLDLMLAPRAIGLSLGRALLTSRIRNGRFHAHAPDRPGSSLVTC